MADQQSIKSDTSEHPPLQPLLYDFDLERDRHDTETSHNQLGENKPHPAIDFNHEDFQNVNTSRGRYSRPNNFRDLRISNRHRIFPNPQDYQFNNSNNDNNNTEVRMSTQTPLSPHSLLQPIQRWNLQFSGARGEDVENYIKRINESRELLVMRELDLLKVIPFTLKDAALTWYRSCVNNFKTWQDVKLALRYRYADPDYQLALREEIAN